MKCEDDMSPAALHGIAINQAYSTEERLQAALQALNLYEERAIEWTGPGMLRKIADDCEKVADDWEKTASEIEQLKQLPEDVPGYISPAKVIRQYRWAAALLRGRARRMEIEAHG